jgi:LssY C-terminus
MSRKQVSKETHGSWYANHVNNVIRLIGLLLLVIAAIFVYRYLLIDIITGRSHFFAFIVLWIFSAYVILPRFYRLFSKLYLPNYFFGRTQTGDGLLGDPINIAFNGKREQLIAAMEAAGWHKAEPVSLGSSLKITYSAVRGSSYPTAPVSSLFLFHKKQEFAFERDLDGNPRKRHHIRFWKTPEKWWLPGGYRADYLAAATFDKNVGLSLFTGQITHKIDANVDTERDFVIDTLKQAKVTTEVTFVNHFTSSYHTRNGGGDMIHTDGALPFVTL